MCHCFHPSTDFSQIELLTLGKQCNFLKNTITTDDTTKHKVYGAMLKLKTKSFKLKANY